jgi:OHCU decarboxylase
VNPNLEILNALPPEVARAALLACCGSCNWARRLADQRPYRNIEELLAMADSVWADLGPDDWLEAFRAHPRIGEKPAQDQGTQAGAWSQQEQSGTHAAPHAVLDELAAANRAYEDRFGFLFIVCATGKSAQEMLALLRARLHNEPGRELRIAAEEQRRITRLRLEKFLGA